jgi:hypothetical protein
MEEKLCISKTLQSEIMKIVKVKSGLFWVQSKPPQVKKPPTGDTDM